MAGPTKEDHIWASSAVLCALIGILIAQIPIMMEATSETVNFVGVISGLIFYYPMSLFMRRFFNKRSS
jgi:hypothetical protein